MRRQVAVPVVVLLATMASASPVHAGPEERPPERYRIEGQPRADGCGGQIILAARNLTFSPRTMFADVVNRTYRLTRRGNRLRGHGRFNDDYACPGTRIVETWDLRQVRDGVLEGSLTSTWRLRPACEPCTIQFAVRALRVR